MKAAVVGACALLIATPAAAQLHAELVASGFTQPVAFVPDPSNPLVHVVVQQDGRVRVLKEGVVQPADFLDLRGVVRDSGEQGLLGLAFAPDFATTGRFFVDFIDLNGDTVIARFTRSSSNPLQADPSSRFDLQWPDGQRVIVQPFSNHNGGHLAFGPDGYLYIGMGDGGSGNDPFHAAQNPQSLLGKMLRIDVAVPASDPEGYDVPPTNPFIGQPGVLPEIWSFGVRNPWRWSFDEPRLGGTGALVIGDVGQSAWEEIDYQPPGRGGRNYGWRNREGAHDNIVSLPPFPIPLVDPIFEYSHAVGSSITGGFVYRGRSLGSANRGRYFFADFIRSRVWSLRLTLDPMTGEATASDVVEHTVELGPDAVVNPSSFGEDLYGELYVVSYAGAVYKLQGTGGGVSTPGRRRSIGAEFTGFAVPRPGTAGGSNLFAGLGQQPADRLVAGTVTRPAPTPVPPAPRPCAAIERLLESLRQAVADDPDLTVTVTVRRRPDAAAEADLDAVVVCLLTAVRR